MVDAAKIDSNITGLRYAEELTIGVLPGSPVWRPLEPNSYDDFGGKITTVARNPINPSRQRKKGVVTDVEAMASFVQDLTQENMQDLLQGYVYADTRRKAELALAVVNGTTKAYEPAAGGTGYRAGDLLFAKNFAFPVNNGLKTVSGVPTATSVVVTDAALVAETGASGTISRVGFQFAAADLTISNSGGLTTLGATAKDLTQLGLTPGEWIYIGGDSAPTQFATAVNKGFARVRSITATAIVLDKTDATFVTDAGAAKTIQIFFGRFLKNETAGLIKRRTYQLERTLGAPDEALPTQEQAEYLVGSVPSQAEFTIQTADKITTKLTFVALNQELRSAAEGLKSGARPGVDEADAFNTSSDFSRFRMSTYVTGQTAPVPLFAYVTEASVTINNNLTPNKAVSVLGAFDVTAGTFEVGGSVTAYFASVEAIRAVRNNANVTLDFHVVARNKGVTIDIPMITLGDGLAKIEQDKPITLPLSIGASTGAAIDKALDFTLGFVFWDYLPNAAQ